MAKNDRRQILEIINEYLYIEYCSIENVIRQLKEVQEKYGAFYEYIYVTVQEREDSCESYFAFTGCRLENDEEYKQRKAIEKYNRQLAEQKEKEAYLALKQKYEGKPDA